MAGLVWLLSAVCASAVTLWSENFDAYADGTTNGPGGKWTADVSQCDIDSNDYFCVSSGRMEGLDLDGEAVWTSEIIAIAGHTNVTATVDLSDGPGGLEDDDYIRVSYQVDNQPETFFEINGSTNNDFGSITAYQGGLSGNELIVRVRLNNDANSEVLRFDNVLVTGVPSDPNYPSLAITNPPADTQVGYTVKTAALRGVCNAAVVGRLTWRNALTGQQGSIAAARAWTISGLPLGTGINTITVSGTNNLGTAESDSVTITRDGRFLLNEILVNPAGSDDNREYIELRRAGGAGLAAGLWVLQVNGNAGSAGVITEAWNIGSLSFGTNGLLTIGNNYNAVPLGGPWSNLVSRATVFGDPSGYGSGDLANGSCTWLVVSNFTGAVNNDLDGNDDGVLDVAPWAEIHDSVGWSDGGAGDWVYSPAALTQSGGTPDAASRLRGSVLARSASAWFNGDITTNVIDRLGRFYDPASVSATMLPGAYLTPGDQNYPPVAAALPIVLNEVYVNPPNSDDEREFVEVLSRTGGWTSLYGLWLLVVDSVGTNRGSVADCWNLSGLNTGTNGLAILGNGYDAPAGGPWSNVIERATVAAEPNGAGSSGWGNGNLADNDDFTLLLVANYSGAQGTDLDADNDGVFDQSPWDAVLDSVGFGQSYAVRVGGGLLPDALARLKGNAYAEDAWAWFGGDMTGTNLTVTLDPAQSFNLPTGGALTPGQPNSVSPTDLDGDALPNGWEQLYFGNATNAPPFADPDTDGADNRSEYLADTQPGNPASVFEFALIEPLGGTRYAAAIGSSSTGRVYQLQTRTNLLTGAWQPSGALRTGTGGSLIVPITNTTPHCFYRTEVRFP